MCGLGHSLGQPAFAGHRTVQQKHSYNILMALWVVVVNSMVGQRFEGDAAAPHWWSCNALIILC